MNKLHRKIVSNEVSSKFLRALQSCYLCICYPFLYPRNRWTGKHYTSLVWYSKIWNRVCRKAYDNISIGYKFYKDPKDFFIEKSGFATLKEGVYAELYKEKGILRIGNRRHIISIDLQKHVGDDFVIDGISSKFTFLGNALLIYHCHKKGDYCETNYGFAHITKKLVKNDFMAMLDKVMEWVQYHIINTVCFIPTYTELDALETGWRKVFGAEICEDIKKALIKKGGRKLLKSYRIMQIKEKRASLRWYDSWSFDELDAIKRKYNRVSRHICVNCGKVATRNSIGWVRPYCVDCAPKDSILLKEGNEYEHAF